MITDNIVVNLKKKMSRLYNTQNSTTADIRTYHISNRFSILCVKYEP